MSAYSGSRQVRAPPGGSSEGWGWAGRSPEGTGPHMENTALCYTCTQKHKYTNRESRTQISYVATSAMEVRARVCFCALYSHRGRARCLRVVLRVDLWRGDLGVTRGLRVGGRPVGLRGRRGFVIVAEVVVFLISEKK